MLENETPATTVQAADEIEPGAGNVASQRDLAAPGNGSPNITQGTGGNGPPRRGRRVNSSGLAVAGRFVGPGEYRPGYPHAWRHMGDQVPAYDRYPLNLLPRRRFPTPDALLEHLPLEHPPLSGMS